MERAFCNARGVKTHVVDHPLAADRLAELRDVATTPTRFRAALDELSHFLVYEATRAHPFVETTVTTPLAEAPVRRLVDPPMVVPIMRAGLGMLSATLALVPDADVGFVGLRRNETTLLPDAYVNTVPDDLDGRWVIVLDPMLATGGSLVHALEMLMRSKAGRITVACVLAAPEGLETVAASGIEVEVFTAAIDDHLNEVAYIVPGLGDAGDRQFGLP